MHKHQLFKKNGSRPTGIDPGGTIICIVGCELDHPLRGKILFDHPVNTGKAGVKQPPTSLYPGQSGITCVSVSNTSGLGVDAAYSKYQQTHNPNDYVGYLLAKKALGV